MRSPCKSTGFAYTAEFVHPTRIQGRQRGGLERCLQAICKLA